MSHVLITGGTGFLGKRLSLSLHAKGYTVTAIGRNQIVGEELQDQGILFKSLDLTSKKAIKDLCKDIDSVIHCAALSSPWGAYQNFYEANVLLTRYLLEEALDQKVTRFIHVSSPSIYCNGKNRLNIKESDPLPQVCINNYAQTKRLAEQEVDRAHAQGLQTITIRPRGIFGKGDTSIFPRLLAANQKGFLPLINGGKARIDITHVNNVVEALLLCLEASPKAFGKKYNITNGDPRTLKELLHLLCNASHIKMRAKKIPFSIAYITANLLEKVFPLFTKKEPPLTRYTVHLLTHSMTLDIEEAKKDLGYAPTTSIEEGIDEFAQSLHR